MPDDATQRFHLLANECSTCLTTQLQKRRGMLAETIVNKSSTNLALRDPPSHGLLTSGPAVIAEERRRRIQHEKQTDALASSFQLPRHLVRDATPEARTCQIVGSTRLYRADARDVVRRDVLHPSERFIHTVEASGLDANEWLARVEESTEVNVSNGVAATSGNSKQRWPGSTRLDRDETR